MIGDAIAKNRGALKNIVSVITKMLHVRSIVNVKIVKIMKVAMKTKNKIRKRENK